jgi:hypothetical protein
VKGQSQIARRDSGAFRVIPQNAVTGEEIYVVVSPAGVGLYTFTDLRVATAEAAELNLRV